MSKQQSVPPPLDPALVQGDPTKQTPPQPLTNAQKAQWNDFIDYMDKQGYKGASALDNRNMALGQNLLNKYNQMRPDNAIKYEDIPRVQQELHNYRAGLVDKWKKGLAQSDEVKKEDDIMPSLSAVDGWLGSKTSSYKFPTAVFTDSQGKQQNFGTNVAAYDAAVSGGKK